jgi:hypothetical protein
VLRKFIGVKIVKGILLRWNSMTRTANEFLEELEKYLIYKLDESKKVIRTPLTAGIEFMANNILRKIALFREEHKVNDETTS